MVLYDDSGWMVLANTTSTNTSAVKCGNYGVGTTLDSATYRI